MLIYWAAFYLGNTSKIGADLTRSLSFNQTFKIGDYLNG